MQIDPRHGEAFLAVIDTGSFELAAERLHLTASAVSLRVRALETGLGTPLVVRSRPCRATPAGQKLLQYLRRARLLEEDLLQELAAGPAGWQEVAIAINADTLGTWLLPALADFLADEQVLVDLSVDDQDHTYALLASGQALACVSSEPQAMRGCIAEPLGIMRYRMLASPAYVARWFPAGFTREAAGRAPVLVFNRKDALQADFLRRRFGLTGGYPCHHVPATEPFLHAIELGIGYGMAPDVQALPALAAGRVLDLAPDMPVDVALYWHRWKVQSPTLERLSRRVVNAARAVLLERKDGTALPEV
ncbi:HTH-type transcriptional regulator ArgP [Chitinilyticum piscinae]|uniref:HTH-type transcriptional regulator ArgP n=1 Tax=Chitinilyticum piscinae TaxID=2866724 RepID=A0A8J7FNR8_9NEIS|nr:HTH-type transcriptional regulator ArgP [Chitinilyticum piscinae]MBE9609464.1 HTH-type transcriptional regulator ArgP [Chitinilyticum piscinae]